ncbi:MAG: response regulator [Myxococcota bacterium]|nr:response regulator [Myxococcota bacterium]
MATILVVDDEPDVRFLVRIVATQRGHEVLEAADGMEALEVLRASAVDAVVTDLNMPRMSGVTLRERIREAWPDLPVLLWTASRHPTHEGEPVTDALDKSPLDLDLDALLRAGSTEVAS